MSDIRLYNEEGVLLHFDALFVENFFISIIVCEEDVLRKNTDGSYTIQYLPEFITLLTNSLKDQFSEHKKKFGILSKVKEC